MIPPASSGPQIKATPLTAPSMPLKTATFALGTDCERIVRAPDRMPPAPMPAIVRPLQLSALSISTDHRAHRIRAMELGAVAQMIEPISNSSRAPK